MGGGATNHSRRRRRRSKLWLSYVIYVKDKTPGGMWVSAVASTNKDHGLIPGGNLYFLFFQNKMTNNKVMNHDPKLSTVSSCESDLTAVIFKNSHNTHRTVCVCVSDGMFQNGTTVCWF